MSVNVTVNPPIEELTEELAKKIPQGISKSMLLAAEIAAGEIRSSIYTTFKNIKGGLARSFKTAMLSSKSLGVFRSGAISDLVYAGIQEEGGEILPKRKYLAQPISYRAKQNAIWPRDVPKKSLYTFISEKGNLILSNGDDLAWVLRKSVTLKPKRYLEKAAKKAADPIAEIIADTTIETLGVKK